MKKTKRRGGGGSKPRDVGGKKTLALLIKLNPLEYALAKATADEFGVSRAELFRRLLPTLTSKEDAEWFRRLGLTRRADWEVER